MEAANALNQMLWKQNKTKISEVDCVDTDNLIQISSVTENLTDKFHKLTLLKHKNQFITWEAD